MLSGGPTDIGDAFPMHSRCTPDASRRHRQCIAEVFAMHRRCLPDVFAKFDWHVIVTYTWDHYTMVWLFNRPYIIVSAYTSIVLLSNRECIGRTSWSFAKTSVRRRESIADAFRMLSGSLFIKTHRECIGTISMLALNFYWHLGDTI